jgi:ribosomal protein L35AE/L33A
MRQMWAQAFNVRSKRGAVVRMKFTRNLQPDLFNETDVG